MRNDGRNIISAAHAQVKQIEATFMQLRFQKQARSKPPANIFFTTLWLPPPASKLPTVQSSCTANQRLCFFFYKNIASHIRTTDKGLPPAIIKSSRGEHKRNPKRNVELKTKKTKKNMKKNSYIGKNVYGQTCMIREVTLERARTTPNFSADGKNRRRRSLRRFWV